MQSCISYVKGLANANMLKLNDNKTSLMLVTSKRAKHLHNLPTSITIRNAQLPFEQSVKNFGFTLDCHLTMNANVSNFKTLTTDLVEENTPCFISMHSQ